MSKRNHMLENLTVNNLILDQMSTGCSHEGTGCLKRMPLCWRLIITVIYQQYQVPANKTLRFV